MRSTGDQSQLLIETLSSPRGIRLSARMTIQHIKYALVVVEHKSWVLLPRSNWIDWKKDDTPWLGAPIKISIRRRGEEECLWH